jgi:PIN domain nuclease of toxin-antitoxin system
VNYVLDASALIAFLRDEPGAERVDGLLTDPTNACYAHVLNLCEVFYDFHRQAGDAVALEALRDLETAGVITREDLEPQFWQEAGRLKSQFRRVSLADCFCTALTERLGAELVTSDHHEFDAIAPLGVVSILFIR